MDWYLVFDPTDRLHSSSLCKGREEALEVISWFKEPENLRVHRVTPDELVRDVTPTSLAQAANAWPAMQSRA